MKETEITDILIDSFMDNWDKPFADFVSTYEDLAIAIMKELDMLKTINVTEKTTVALQGSFNTQWIVSYLALILNSSNIVIIPKDIAVAEITRLILQYDVNFIFITNEPKLSFTKDDVGIDIIVDNYLFSMLPTLKAVISKPYDKVLISKPSFYNNALLLTEFVKQDFRNKDIAKHHIFKVFSQTKGFNKLIYPVVNEYSTEIEYKILSAININTLNSENFIKAGSRVFVEQLFVEKNPKYIIDLIVNGVEFENLILNTLSKNISYYYISSNMINHIWNIQIKSLFIKWWFRLVYNNSFLYFLLRKYMYKRFMSAFSNNIVSFVLYDNNLNQDVENILLSNKKVQFFNSEIKKTKIEEKIIKSIPYIKDCLLIPQIDIETKEDKILVVIEINTEIAEAFKINVFDLQKIIKNDFKLNGILTEKDDFIILNRGFVRFYDNSIKRYIYENLYKTL